MPFPGNLFAHRQAPLSSSLLIAALLLVGYWLGPISSWETNDDVMYQLLLSGKLVANAPDPHLIMVNYLLASTWTGLYSIFPQVSWYAFSQVAFIVLAVFFLNYSFALAHGGDKFLLRLLVSLTSALPFLFHLQFTKTALVMGVAGYLGLILLSRASEISRRQRLAGHAVAITFLVLSFALRQESFFLATIVCLVPVGAALLRRDKLLLVGLGLTGALIGTFALVHRYNYGDDWQEFFALGKLSGPILNYNQYRYDENRAVYDAVGWSRNDYLFFRSWGYIDSKVYSREFIEQIVTNAQANPSQRTPLAALAAAASFPAHNYLVTLALLSAGVLILHRRRSLLVSAGVLLVVLVAVGFLAWEGRFPTRVSTALAFTVPWLLFLESGPRRRGVVLPSVALIVFLAASVPLYGQYRDLGELARYRHMQNGELRRLGEAVANAPVTMAVLGATFPFEGLLPFEPVDYLDTVKVVWLCGFNQSPVQRKQLDANGIGDIFGTLLTEKNAYIVMSPMETGIFQRYMQEHYGRDVSVSPVFVSGSFRVYQVGG